MWAAKIGASFSTIVVVLVRSDFQIDNVTPSLPLAIVKGSGRRINTGVARFLQAAGYYPEPVVFGGYATQERARIMGRVIMAFTAGQRSWLRERRGWRQFFDAQVPFEPVVVRFGDAQMLVETDADGYFDIVLEGHGLPSGHHEVKVAVLNRRDVRECGGLDGVALGKCGVRATASVGAFVRVIGDDECCGVVSDIDDTIVVSMIPRPFVAARYALLEHVSAREAVPGMSEFLRFVSGISRQLTRGVGGSFVDHARAWQRGRVSFLDEALAPQVYISTGAWNMVPVLRDFVARVKCPEGAFLMTDFGPSNTGWFRSGREHKRRELRRLVEFFPNMRWVLVGDDGQRDPMIYAEFAKEFPEHVAAIAIRSLSPVELFLNHATPVPIVPGALRDVPESVPVLFGRDGYELLDRLQGEKL